MKIGGLYQTNQYYWMLYPSKDTATAAVGVAGRIGAAAVGLSDAVGGYADYWSKRLDCNVSYISPKDMFMLLEKEGIFCKILSTEANIGWIILSQWCKKDIVEVTQ